MALLKIGEKPIQSFNDETCAAQLARTLFDNVTDALLSSHPWRFATKKYDLVRTGDDDFLIPTDVVRVLSSSAPKYEINGNRIVAAGEKISVACTARIGVENYPAYFSSVAAIKLAMEFCMPLTDNSGAFNILAALFESEMRAAKFIDSSTSIAPDVKDFSLISARF